MSTILAISGSPSATSRTAAVLDLVSATLLDAGHQVRLLSVRDLPPEALLGADPTHPAIRTAATEVAAADAVVVATPVYKAAYSGVLKSLLDLLPQFAFAGKVVLPLATGGTTAHVLALDYALRPVLSSMGAEHVVAGYFLPEQALGPVVAGGLRVEPAARAGLDDVVDGFLAALERRQPLPILLAS
ncbi:NADPH-dependent FMN reductase [Micromonospora sp. NBC_01813]|uniref:NADPH-dependent FMN reductase n=1 Tax=Micromonospora sp. NBC_01813 TaxID=2975988 RepID=UPI002DD7FD66|nr:NADPH-dependent FMN reductase [Micromonospora sp. NBC_01813]WSA09215.1 NADPH-dependent FMN reductase [Micromonospora sp. NBC_01813]